MSTSGALACLKDCADYALREVNNAAAGGFGLVLTSSQETIKKMFDVNAVEPIYLMQVVVPSMPHGGRIINIGTVASRLGITGLPLYAASKQAMATLSFAMAQEVT